VTAGTEAVSAVSTVRIRVTAAEVSDARRHIRDSAQAIGLDRHYTDQFLVAANEIIINAVQHGGGIADVTIVCDGGRVLVEVVDQGPGLSVTAPESPPPADQPHGRGLWLAARLCNDVTFDSTPHGTRVRLATPVTGS
jgi:serine/threonine-protein kinase RsbW